MSPELLSKLERIAARHPGALRLRAAWANQAGYLVLAGLMFLGVGLPAGVLALVAVSDSGWNLLVQFLIHGGFLLPIASWQILTALQMPAFEPEGIEVDETIDRGLRDEVDRMAQILDAPRPERILLTPELGAAAVQRPRLRPGEGGDVLLVGLPLLECLDLEEFRSVLAHELGHFAGGDGRRWGSMVRQGLAWSRLHGKIKSGELRSRWLGAIIGRFEPWHACHAFVLSRSQERLADDSSVRAVGGDVPARALARVTWCARWTEEKVWDPVWKLASRGLPMPESVFDEHASALREPVTKADADRIWQEVLASTPSETDTHPPLAERLRAMGGDPLALGGDISRMPGESAAAILLRDLDGLRARMSDKWAESSRPAWDLLGEIRKAQSKRRAELEESAATDAASILERAELIGQLDGPEVALEFLAGIPSVPDEDVRIRILRARLGLLAEREGSGDALERILEEDPSLGREILPQLVETAARQGDAAKAEALRERLQRTLEAWARAEEEAGTITEADRLEQPLIEDSLRRRLGLVILEDDSVTGAWLLRKVVDGPEGTPAIHVVFVERKSSFLGASTAETTNKIVDGVLGRVLSTGLIPGIVSVCLLGEGSGDVPRRILDSHRAQAASLP